CGGGGGLGGRGRAWQGGRARLERNKFWRTSRHPWARHGAARPWHLLSGQVKAEQLAILINQYGAFLALALAWLGLARPLPWTLARPWLKRNQLAGIRCGQELLLLVKLNRLKPNPTLGLHNLPRLWLR
ncbi:hypothetical protein, partial [Meiothermus hypogaeus]|uniref:hypothetical protein n=1 Tax=Meiothermus hypogaeus TaxID=884155 RepID=UPI0014750EE1